MGEDYININADSTNAKDYSSTAPTDAYYVSTVDKNSEPILFWDCDTGDLTLMKCIQDVREMVKRLPTGELTLYIVKGLEDEFAFGWDFLWNYLNSTSRKFNVVIRGYFPQNAVGCFNYENFNVYLSDDIVFGDIDSSNLKYETI